MTWTVLHPCSSAKKRTEMLAQRRVHHQLLSLQFRPMSGSHFLPVDILGTLNTSRHCFRQSYRERIYEKRVFLDLASALRAGCNMTLGHCYAFRSCRFKLRSSFVKRGHESV